MSLRLVIGIVVIDKLTSRPHPTIGNRHLVGGIEGPTIAFALLARSESHRVALPSGNDHSEVQAADSTLGPMGMTWDASFRHGSAERTSASQRHDAAGARLPTFMSNPSEGRRFTVRS